MTPSNWPLHLMIIASFAVLTGSIIVLATPDKWDKATLIYICQNGTPILQLTDGTVWAKMGLRAWQLRNLPAPAAARTICQ